MNRTLKATAAIMLMMVFAVGCGKQPVEPQKQAPEGAGDGLFSISENKQVYFSQGNLQYQPSSNTWQFARNQYDIIERNDYLQIDENYDGWIDAFAWGTSGNNHGAVCYQPWSNSENDFDFFAYGDSVANLYDHTGQADWGYNRILNGGNQTGLWRTLTKDEWEYILDKRSTISGARFAHAVVNGVLGIVLFLIFLQDSLHFIQHPFNKFSGVWVQDHFFAVGIVPVKYLCEITGSKREAHPVCDHFNDVVFWHLERLRLSLIVVNQHPVLPVVRVIVLVMQPCKIEVLNYFVASVF